MNSLHPENPVPGEPAPVPTPIDASGTATAVIARQLLLQLVVVAGALVAALGLPETSVIAQVVRFLRSEAAVPLIGALAAPAASIYLMIRAKRKHRALQVVSSLPGVPDAVAIGPANPPAAVERALEAATLILDAARKPREP